MESVQELLDAAVERRVLPGAVLVVTDRSGAPDVTAAGTIAVHDATPVTRVRVLTRGPSAL